VYATAAEADDADGDGDDDTGGGGGGDKEKAGVSNANDDCDDEKSIIDATIGRVVAALNNFEHNLEVWRQLWRVSERSDVILVCELAAND
jgi:hypothetical protein